MNGDAPLPPVPEPWPEKRNSRSEVHILIQRSFQPQIAKAVEIATEGVLDLLESSPDDLKISRRQFSILVQELRDIADDGGTQPAYRRGMYRALSAVQNVLVDQRPPNPAARDTILVYGDGKGADR